MGLVVEVVFMFLVVIDAESVIIKLVVVEVHLLKKSISIDGKMSEVGNGSDISKSLIGSGFLLKLEIEKLFI